MKSLIMIIDGMADRPIPELGEKTPLEVAETPNMDKLAENGING
ncbi:MAG: phosphoglycerate mutase, partial [Methanobacteriaceae archaeon]|nr:phosphoglycerate mutase [Methanobacteriaceae archaeon]